MLVLQSPVSLHVLQSASLRALSGPFFRSHESTVGRFPRHHFRARIELRASTCLRTCGSGSAPGPPPDLPPAPRFRAPLNCHALMRDTELARPAAMSHSRQAPCLTTSFPTACPRDRATHTSSHSDSSGSGCVSASAASPV